MNSPPSILNPGQTCWRITRADRMAVIVDAAAYFSLVKTAMLQAEHSVLLIGWDFDTRIELERDGHDPSLPNRLGPFLSWIVRRRPHLRVYALRWDLAFLKMPFRGTTPLFLLDWITSRRLHFCLDSHHPPGGCHHQKIVVIDDALAFCGAIDITRDRWDTPAHQDDDPRRTTPTGQPHGPWHDVTTAVDGQAARALGDLARARWKAATGRTIPPPPGGLHRWPAGLNPAFQDVNVAIARTEPAYDGRPAVREIEALYRAAIMVARRTIYLESQYFSADSVAKALIQRLAEPDGPEVVIVNPSRAEGWLEEKVMGSTRALLLQDLRAADKYGRLRFLCPVTDGGADIYVHAKVLVIDQILLRVGSSNINNRSMGLDTECDLAIEASPDDPADDHLRAGICDVRDSLVAEHLGVDQATLRRVLDETGGSLVHAVDRLARPGGRTLVRFEPPALTETEYELARTQVFDPSHPEGIDRMLVRTMRVLPAKALVGLAAVPLALAGAILAWRRARADRA